MDDDQATATGKPNAAQRGTSRAAPKPPPPPPRRPSVKVLALVDKSQAGFRESAESFLSQEMGLSSSQIKGSIALVDKWADVGPMLGRYERIETLVVVAHGSPGALSIGNTVRGLDLAAKDLKPPMCTAHTVDFEACNVGDRPDGLLAFATALSATRVMAWNYYRITSFIDVIVPKNVDEAELQKRLAPFEPWLLANHPPIAAIVKSPGTTRLAVEWFRDVDDNTPLPKDLTREKAQQLRRTFKSRADARNHTYSAAQAASLKGQSEAPVVPFERVIIDL